MTPETGGIDYQWWDLFFSALMCVLVGSGIFTMTYASRFRSKEIDKQHNALRELIKQGKEESAKRDRDAEASRLAQTKALEALTKAVEQSEASREEQRKDAARRDRDAEASRKSLEAQTAALIKLLESKA